MELSVLCVRKSNHFIWRLWAQIIRSFFCDISPLLILSFLNTHIMNYLFFFIGGFIQMILVFYMFIVATLLRIFLAEVKSKAFSALSSHLTDVTLFYGSITFIYMWHSSNYSLDQDQAISVFYMVIILLSNCIIYCLRKMEVIDFLKISSIRFKTSLGKNYTENA